MASSMARSSPPTARETRSFSSASSGVGAFMEREGKGGSTDDDAVFHLDLRSRWKALELDHRELVLDFHNLPRSHFLVQLPEKLAGDRVHDGDLVAAKAHGAAEPHAIGGRQVDDDARGIDEDDVPACSAGRGAPDSIGARRGGRGGHGA